MVTSCDSPVSGVVSTDGDGVPVEGAVELKGELPECGVGEGESVELLGPGKEVRERWLD